MDRSAIPPRTAGCTINCASSCRNRALCLPVVPARRLIFYRERAAQAYGALPFWLAETVVEAPWLVLNAAAYSVITYWR